MADSPGVVHVDELVPVSDRQAIVARYRQIRKASVNLNNRLIHRITDAIMQEGGTKLGMLRGRDLFLDHEDQSAVLMDYCLYEVPSGGRTIVESLTDSPPASPDEAACVAAMQQAWYSLFVVEAVEPDLGCVVRDLRTQDIRLVVDMGFSRTAKPGLIIATRLIPFDTFAITGGAALPVPVVGKKRQQALAERYLTILSPQTDRFDPAPLIRDCLRQGFGDRVRYEAPLQNTKSGGRPGERFAEAPLGRNSPCPCGSGKKYKQCCLRRK